MLYSNTSSEYPNCGSGTDITSPLDGAFSELHNVGSVVYYDISRFHVEDYNYPNVGTV